MTGYETENSHRNYPLASNGVIRSEDGMDFPVDVFVDAMIYPRRSSGVLKLVEFDSVTGSVKIQDDQGNAEITGQESGGTIHLYQNEKYAGTIACGPGFSREKLSGRKWSFDSAYFSAKCVMPLSPTRVTSIAIDGTDVVVETSIVAILGAKGSRFYAKERKETIDGVEYGTLQFNLSSKWNRDDGDTNTRMPVRKIIVVHKKGSLINFNGGAPVSNNFNDGGGVLVYMPRLTREDICYQANKSEAVVSLYDTCPGEEMECIEIGPDPSDDDKERQISSGIVHITSGDVLGYHNPLKISAVLGQGVANTPKMSSVMKYEDATKEAEKLTRAQNSFGNGLKFEIPGS